MPELFASGTGFYNKQPCSHYWEKYFYKSSFITKKGFWRPEFSLTGRMGHSLGCHVPDPCSRGENCRTSLQGGRDSQVWMRAFRGACSALSLSWGQAILQMEIIRKADPLRWKSKKFCPFRNAFCDFHSIYIINYWEIGTILNLFS